MKIGHVISMAMLAPVALIGWCTVQNLGFDSAFPKVRPGMFADEVIQRMGTPSWDTACFASKYNPYGSPKPGCAQEIGYFDIVHGFPDGHYYVVWFDAAGTVIGTAPISSP